MEWPPHASYRTHVAQRLDPAREERLLAGAKHATQFFMGVADVQRALEKVARLLREDEIPYALIGAMAVNEYGYQRVTVDVDLLLSLEGLTRFKEHHLGRDYVERFPGSKGLRDVENGVSIDIVLAGEYPGDGLPKPVKFPDPAEAALVGERLSVLPLPKLIELKLASGMTAPHRLKDLADVLELIRSVHLTEDFGRQLDPFVQPKYLDLWRAAQSHDPEER
jgi:hypothetical protein